MMKYAIRMFHQIGAVHTLRYTLRGEGGVAEDMMAEDGGSNYYF